MPSAEDNLPWAIISPQRERVSSLPLLSWIHYLDGLVHYLGAILDALERNDSLRQEILSWDIATTIQFPLRPLNTWKELFIEQSHK